MERYVELVDTGKRLTEFFAKHPDKDVVLFVLKNKSDGLALSPPVGKDEIPKYMNTFKMVKKNKGGSAPYLFRVKLKPKVTS